MVAEFSNPLKIKPYFFVHLLDKNDNIERLIVGPKTVVLQEHEEVIDGIQSMISLNIKEYAVIENPSIKNDKNQVVFDDHGMAKLNHGEFEYRFYQEPFPLYPGEKLVHIKSMETIDHNSGMIVEVVSDHIDSDNNQRLAGELVLIRGPAIEIRPNTALRLKATRDCRDSFNIPRKYGDEWLVKTPGSYLPTPYEAVVATIEAITITPDTALHMKSLRAHVDEFGKTRKYGSEYLILESDTCSHIPNVDEELVKIVSATVLDQYQYCVIVNPVDENFIPKYGSKKMIRGEAIFFLYPGESLENGIEKIYILGNDEALLVKAEEPYKGKRSGESWLINGPTAYVPPIQVRVVELRKAIPLDVHEGIYVRNMKTGNVRSIIGQTYILNEDEELWEKELPEDVYELLNGSKGIDRSISPAPIFHVNQCLSKARVVTYRVPHNSAVQIYDFKAKNARVVYGPEYVMLGPDEQFTRLSLSGGKPKEPNRIKSLCLLLGPDFSTDIITVETADHARLSLKLSYNWHFEIGDKNNQEESAKLFAVPDFIGDMCKTIASRVRGVVASIPFDEFHKNSSRIIRKAFFGLDVNNKVYDSFKFIQNNMVVTNIDVQSVEPIDQKTKDSLQKSVQLAIEITTNSQEAAARREGECLEQESKGKLERQRIVDQAEVEKVRQKVIQLQLESTAIESCGQAQSEAQSKLVSCTIDGESAIQLSDLKSKAADIDAQHDLERLKNARMEELRYMKETLEREVNIENRKNQLELFKFERMIESITPQTLTAIATIGHDHDIRMLECLGLKSTLITDGSSPVNLLHTASGLIKQAVGVSNDMSWDDKISGFNE